MNEKTAASASSGQTLNAPRASQIRHKLQFALSLERALTQEICAAQWRDGDVSFLEEKAGQILGTCRECFDYAAKDLFEAFVLPLPGEPSLRNRYARGKVKVYFPFHRDQLLKHDQPFAALRTAQPGIFAFLSGFVAALGDGQLIPNTDIPFKTFTEANAMSNQKKHESLIRSATVPNATTIITGSGTAIGTQPIGTPREPGEPLAPQMVGGPGVTIRYAKDFFFERNGARVGSFCVRLVQGTNLFLNRLYVIAFGIDPQYFDPWKSEAAAPSG